ncbi:RNA polymerase sigma-70 factor, ECF subfamily [Chitinophaga ginsengisegetis]|uniref:RNA polymerase sigma-70 factor, ECF subfamily n=1 Tax=Chitinophaga ginsengisegetis TaxID=393003 RepID=A0A1T5N575_9BACT|nr:RNA polymerase sigma-70 factor, ECF subfamily [Chitinophaga ginsengisegetis]
MQPHFLINFSGDLKSVILFGGDLQQEELVRLLQAGDQQAFRKLFDLLYQPLCFFARKITGSAEEAEDVVSTAFARLWDRHSHFVAFPAIQSFLYTTVRNQCLNILKHQEVVSNAAKILQSEPQEMDNYIETQVLQAELLQIIFAEMSKLPERQRLILEWTYRDGLPAAEIAQQLQMSPAHVRMEKSRAMSQLRHMLRERKLLGLFMALFPLIQSGKHNF